MSLAVAATATMLLVAAWVVRKILKWNARIWIGSYLKDGPEPADPAQPLDVCFVFADHFEPNHGKVAAPVQVDRVRRWQDEYARAVEGHCDSDGRCPQHTWFVPGADPAAKAVEVIATWPGRGWGEMEYHLHHDEIPAIGRKELTAWVRKDLRFLQDHGALSAGRYGFIHGVYALAGGDPRFCQVADELDVLLETGCYGDFTFPDIETPAQPQQVNSIYYARTTGRPKPYDTGQPACVGRRGQGLLMIPGPMCMGWFTQVFDDANLCSDYLPDPRRIRRWLEAHVHVQGRPNWVFIVLHSHSATESGQGALWNGQLASLWQGLENRFKTPHARLHYMTAREAVNVIKAAEACCQGNPSDYRDYELAAPANCRRAVSSADKACIV